MSVDKDELEEYPASTFSAESFFLILLALGGGTLLGVVVLPSWLPHLAASLFGPKPQAFWYLSRGSAFVALSLLWISMVLGLLITNKMSRVWPGATTAFAIHEYVSLLGVGFAMFHAIILVGDKFIGFTLAQIAIPFASSYLPLYVGLGQVGFYAMLIVTLSFYFRKRLGHKTWRTIHYASFLVYLIALFHGLTSGTDTALPWAHNYYWFSAGSLLFLLIYRILTRSGGVSNKRAPAMHTGRKRSASS